MTIRDDLLIHTADVVRPATVVDEYGNKKPDYGPGATRTTISAWLQTEQRTERFPDGRNPNEEVWLLITDHADIVSDDRVEWADHPRGPVIFDVHGPPEPTYSAASKEFHHTEATLRILEG